MVSLILYHIFSIYQILFLIVYNYILFGHFTPSASSCIFKIRQIRILEGILNACERAANLLEACELVPMADPPTRRINLWRKEEKPDVLAIRRFAYELAEKLKEIALLV